MSNKAGTNPSLPSEAVILDLPLLDEYFLDWVVDRIRRILQRLKFDGAVSSDIVTNVLLKFLRPVAHCVILMTTRGQTPATRLLGLQRVPITTTNKRQQQQQQQVTSSSSSFYTRRDYHFRLVAYTLFSTIVPVLYAELKEWYRQRLRERLATDAVSRYENATRLSHDNNETTNRHGVAQVAAERKFQSVEMLIQVVTQIWPVLRLVALLGVWSGASQTSEVAMLLTGWTYQKQRQEEPRLHVDYAQRRWVWEELLRTLRVWGQGLTLLSVWRNDVQQWKDNLLALIMARKNRSMLGSQGQEEHSSSTGTLSMCCFCEAKPIIIPVKLHPCGHAACYACLHERSKGAVRCRLCKLRVAHATSWTMT